MFQQQQEQQQSLQQDKKSNHRYSTSSSNSDLSFLDLPATAAAASRASSSSGGVVLTSSTGDVSRLPRGSQEDAKSIGSGISRSTTSQETGLPSDEDSSTSYKTPCASSGSEPTSNENSLNNSTVSTCTNDSTITLRNVSSISSNHANFSTSREGNEAAVETNNSKPHDSTNAYNDIKGNSNILRNHQHAFTIPLASDEDASSGSLTPPSSKRQAAQVLANGLQHLNSNNNSAKNDISFAEASSRKSWLFIDSPASTSGPNNHLNPEPNTLLDFNRKWNQQNAGLHRECVINSARTSRLFDLKNSQPDPILHFILEGNPGKDTLDNDDDPYSQDSRNVRQEGRHPALMALYSLEEDSSLIENRPVPRPPKEHLGHRMVVKCTQIKFDLDVEPIFVTLALYDVREKKKMSENFYFDMNTEPTKKMLLNHIPYQDISTLARSCIFNITHPTCDMFFVIKMEKVLQGDPSDSIDPYVSRDEKARERLKINASLCCERLGKYRQPFAWTAFSLMDVLEGAKSQMDRDSGIRDSVNSHYHHHHHHHGSNETIDSDASSLDRRSSGSTGYETMKRLGDTLTRMGSLERTPRSEQQTRRSWTSDELSHAMDTFVPITITINSVFKQEYDKLKDEDLFKILPELKKNSSTYKKLKHINCTLKLDVAPVRDQPKYCLTPELAKLHPYPDEKARPLKELLEFPLREVLKPHYIYRNLLFIYPKNLNFSNRPGSARNITCKVQVMCGEDDYSALNAIFGRSGCPEFTSEAFTSVVYHNKSPDFTDEFKVKLPSKLMDQHHLLFTFYHISCHKNKLKDTIDATNGGKEEKQESCPPLGWTWLPLYREGRLQTGTFHLPVMMEKPPTSYSFLTPFIQIPNTKWVDNHKEVFTVTVEAETSIHTQDACLDNFLQLATCIEEENIPIRYQNNIEYEFRKSILSIWESSVEPLVKFFPIIMNKLVRLLVRPPVVSGATLNTSQNIFESMTMIVNKISRMSDSAVKTSLLTTFSHYQCLFPHPESFPVTSDRVVSPNGSFHVRSNSIPNMKQFLANCATSSPDPNSHYHSHTVKSQTPGIFNRMQSMRCPGVGKNFVKGQLRNHHHQRSLDFDSIPNSSEDDVFSPNSSLNVTNINFSSHKKLFHEELLLQWVVSSGNARELSFTNPSFFFDLIIKSASEHLAVSGVLLTSSLSSRRDRFTIQFMDDVVTLVNCIVSELVIRLNRDTKDMEFIQKLNSSLAFFIRDLLNLADRSFVFSLIKSYCENISQVGHPIPLMSESVINQLCCLKIDFLRIVCNHEHYFALNLPFNSPLFPSENLLARSNSFVHKKNIHPATSSIISSLSFLDQVASFTELSEDYRRQHFLAGLVLSTLVSSLDVPSAVVQAKAVALLRNLIGHHDWDPRCQENKEVRSKLASLYLPLISIVMDSLSQLHDFSNGSLMSGEQPVGMNIMTRSNTLKRSDFKRRPVSRRNSLSESDLKETESGCSSKITSPVDPNVANAIAGNLVTNAILANASKRYPLREDTTKDLLLCFLWVIKNAPNDLITQLCKELSLHRLTQLIDILHLCVSCFHYKGRKTVNNLGTATLRKNSDLKLKLEDAIMGLGSARRGLIMRRRDRVTPGSSTQSFSSADFPLGVNLRWKKDSIKAVAGYTNMKGKTKEEIDTELTLSGHLSTEVSLVVLDVLDTLCVVVTESGDTSTLR